MVLRICFVGCGRIAEVSHAPGLRRECGGLVEITACVDTFLSRAEKFAARFAPSATAYSSLKDALASGTFDAVNIMVPHHLHASIAIHCFESGKHVLLEKPVAPSLSDCARIFAAAEASGKVFMVAEQSQYWGSVLAARDAIRRGAIGTVQAVKACYRDRPGVWTDVLAGENASKPWRHIAAIAGGGLVIDGGAHWLRPMRMLVPDADVSHVCSTLARPDVRMDGESLAFALIKFDNGVIGTFEAARVGSWGGPRDMFNVQGSTGEIAIDSEGKQVMLFSEEHGPTGHALDTTAWRRHPHGMVLREFAEAVLKGKTPAATAQDAMGELRIALAMYESDKTGTWAAVWDDDDDDDGSTSSLSNDRMTTPPDAKRRVGVGQPRPRL